MALKPTIHQVELEMVDLDRNHFHTYRLTLARHASETPDRMMVRLLAFALDAHERLLFGEGIGSGDEPDLWQKDLTGQVELWIELGHPDERVVARACGVARQVKVYTYSANPDRWYEPVRQKLARLANLSLWMVAPEEAEALGALVDKRMGLQCTVQDGTVWFRDDQGREAEVHPEQILL